MSLIKTRILIVGANGLLGQALVNYYSKRKDVELHLSSIEDKFVGNNQFSYSKLDITKRNEVKNLFLDFFPEFVINAAAYTDVDGCEVNREIAWKINVNGVKHLVEGCRVVDAQLVHISTDFIFDGQNGPYHEDDKPNPISYYGRTKFASENEIKMGGIPFLIIRTNVLYGIQKGVKKDFVEWVVENLSSGKQINVVTDQWNNPTYVDDLVNGISLAIDKRKNGIYHIGGLEYLSRYDFALKIAEVFGLEKELINKTTTDKLNQKAKRPLRGGLIILKAQSELGYKPHTLEENLLTIKQKLGK
ncbi:MAG: dTDP-4-dehydrorhamnose reductase [Ignavibacteria bacterium]|nr:dTDP-4-dehydrorhamnose reductase [Ignavibacteria bacterium]